MIPCLHAQENLRTQVLGGVICRALLEECKGFFCRSVTMDAWTDEQLNKMKLGGNKRLNDFLSQYEVDKMTPVSEKYHSRAAEVRTLLWIALGFFVGMLDTCIRCLWHRATFILSYILQS